MKCSLRLACIIFNTRQLRDGFVSDSKSESIVRILFVLEVQDRLALRCNHQKCRAQLWHLNQCTTSYANLVQEHFLSLHLEYKWYSQLINGLLVLQVFNVRKVRRTWHKSVHSGRYRNIHHTRLHWTPQEPSWTGTRKWSRYPRIQDSSVQKVKVTKGLVQMEGGQRKADRERLT